jgi:single-strand DNA-binding protein
MNTVIVSGNLVKQVEIKYTADGKAVANCSIAYNEKYNNKETVSFFDVVLWGKTAENCAEYLDKGSKVLIEGALRQDSWEKDGQKHYRIKIIARRVEFLGGKKGDTSQSDQGEAKPDVDIQSDASEDKLPF